MVCVHLALGWSTSREQDITRSEKLLLEVLECDRNDPRARHVLGRLRRIQNRLIEAQIELEKAIALDRNNSGATLQLGVTLMFMGEPEAALPHVEKALRLNPRYQDVFYYYYWLGYCHLLMGHANEAVGLFRKCRAAYPEGWFTHLYLAAALGLRGDIDEARTALAHSIKLKSEFDSIARLRAAPSHSAMDNPQFVALREKTLEIGLRRAGLPEE
jgi:tetratricopeptide (TPR) repeat protein